MSGGDMVGLAGNAVDAPDDDQRVAVRIRHSGGEGCDGAIMRTAATQSPGSRANERRRLILKRANIAAGDLRAREAALIDV